MNDLQKRFYLFIFGCIGVRTLFTVAAAHASASILQILGGIALLFVLGWLHIMLFGERDTGPEVFGGKIWWQNLRPLHALLWAGFAYGAIHGIRSSYRLLAIDTFIGLCAFLFHHYRNGDLEVMLQIKI
jgi:hypothetical protein